MTTREDLATWNEKLRRLLARGVITESEYGFQCYFMTCHYLICNPGDLEPIPSFYPELPDASRRCVEEYLTQLPCEGGFWWRIGGTPARDLGAYRPRVEACYSAPDLRRRQVIEAIRRSITDYLSSIGETRNTAPGAPVRTGPPEGVTANMRRLKNLPPDAPERQRRWFEGPVEKTRNLFRSWLKSDVSEDEFIGEVVDYLDPDCFEDDISELTPISRDDIVRLFSSYHSRTLSWGSRVPIDFEWQRQREDKYIAIMAHFGLTLPAGWRRKIKVQEYVEFDQRSNHRYEYYIGDVLPLDPDTPARKRIRLNLYAILEKSLRGSDLKLYGSDLRIRTGSALLTHTDASVFRDALDYDYFDNTTVLNPAVLFDILPSFDRPYREGYKGEHYQTIGALQEYVQISLNEPRVDLVTRHQGGPWPMQTAMPPEQSIWLESIGCELRLAELYEGVDFSRASVADQSPSEEDAPPGF